jgi:hypothetical protein
MSQPTSEERLTRKFRDLNKSNFKVTSPQDGEYNCIAWAFGRDDLVWWPVPTLSDGNPLGGYYWPYGVSLDDSLEAFIEAFRQFGYEPCESDDLEPGYEKIAIYVGANRMPTHAARQLENGNWSSKLGPSHDIEHSSLAVLTGKDYGLVGQIMRRSRTNQI